MDMTINEATDDSMLDQWLASINDAAIFDYDLMLGQSVEWTEIKALRADTKILETYRITGSLSDNPGMYAFLRWTSQGNHYDWHMLRTSWQERSEAQKLEHAIDSSKASAPVVKRLKRNREHERAYIVLHEEVTTTCEETGISFAVRLPIPTHLSVKLNLPTISPLAHYQNVSTVLDQYQRSGIAIERELESQVLVGILITVLRHKGKLWCKDAPKANAFLQAATRDTLGYAIRFFNSQVSTVGMPGISLELEDMAQIRDSLKHIHSLTENQKASQLAELFLLNHIRAWKGESTIDEASHIKLITPKQEKKIRVYTDSTTRQFKEIEAIRKECSGCLVKLIAKHPGQHTLLFGQLKQSFRVLASLTEVVLGQHAKILRDTFPKDGEAFRIAELLEDIETDMIVNDLPSFTQEVHAKDSSIEAQGMTTKRAPVDFLSKLTPKGNG